MRLVAIFLAVFLFFSCTKTKKIYDDVFIKINNIALHRDNILELEIINNSNKNYFICMDSTSIYENNEFNPKINKLLHPQILFYFKGDSVNSEPKFSLPNYISRDTSRFKCVMKKLKLAPIFIKKIQTLKKILILKSKDTISIKMPFKNTYEICNRDYTFLLKKGNYEIELKYKMDKHFFEEVVSKTELENLKKQKILPYYNEIKSNRIPMIIE